MQSITRLCLPVLCMYLSSCATVTSPSNYFVLCPVNYQKMWWCPRFYGSRCSEPLGTVWGLGSGSQTQREWVVSIIAGGRQRAELSPAQIEPTNVISVSNTIVVLSQPNAIILSPVLQGHSEQKPQSQTFGPTFHLITDVDKNALSPLWSDQGVKTHCFFSLNWPEQSQ